MAANGKLLFNINCCYQNSERNRLFSFGSIMFGSIMFGSLQRVAQEHQYSLSMLASLQQFMTLCKLASYSFSDVQVLLYLWVTSQMNKLKHRE